MKTKEIKGMQRIVKGLLEALEVTRDSDDKLVSLIWGYELGVSTKYTKQETLVALFEGALSSYSSISRARRLVQAEFPELRGKSYKGRQEAEVEVRENINQI